MFCFSSVASGKRQQICNNYFIFRLPEYNGMRGKQQSQWMFHTWFGMIIVCDMNAKGL